MATNRHVTNVDDSGTQPSMDMRTATRTAAAINSDPSSLCQWAVGCTRAQEAQLRRLPDASSRTRHAGVRAADHKVRNARISNGIAIGALTIIHAMGYGARKNGRIASLMSRASPIATLAARIATLNQPSRAWPRTARVPDKVVTTSQRRTANAFPSDVSMLRSRRRSQRRKDVASETAILRAKIVAISKRSSALRSERLASACFSCPKVNMPHPDPRYDSIASNSTRKRARRRLLRSWLNTTYRIVAA